MRILSAKYLITMVGEPIIDGAVVIDGDEILDVGTEQDLVNRYQSASHEDYPHHVILPGLINGHTHLDLTKHQNFPSDPMCLKSGAEINFVDWLIGCFTYKQKATDQELHQAVDEGIDHCFAAGTTCVADMSSYHGVVALFEQRGLRAVVFPEVVSTGSDAAKGLFENAMGIIERYIENDSDLVSVGAGPYSPFTLSRNILRIMSQYCRSSELPLMTHVAESFSEMEFFHNSSGDIATKLFPSVGWDDLPPHHHVTPIQYLAKIGFLDARPLLVGCTQVTSQDMDLIAATGSKVVLTPRSHVGLQQGVAPYRELSERRIMTVLGTDGMPSVQTLSLWDEMRAFVELQEAKTRLTGSEVLSMVTTHAAMALGLEEDIGAIKKGLKADLLVIDTTHVPTDGDLLMNLIKSIDHTHIQNTIVGGVNVKSVN